MSTTKYKQDLDVTGNITLSGNVTADGNVILGDADTDSITLNADITSSIIPDVTNTYDLGSTGKNWRDLFVSNDITVGNRVTALTVATLDDVIVGADLSVTGDGAFGSISSSGALNISSTGTITINNQKIAGLADPTAAQDAATKAYVDQAELDAATTANSYTDTRETAITTAYQTYTDTAETDAVTTANAYTDTAIAGVGGGGSEIQYGQAGASGVTLNPGDTAVIKLLGDLTGNSVGVVLSRNLDGNDRLINNNFSPSAFATYTNSTGSAITGVNASLVSNPVNFFWFVDRA